MKYVASFIIKFVMTAVILEIILSLLTTMTLGDILIVSAAVAVLGYILGDLFFVPSYGNIAATIADLVLAWITIYVFNFIWAARAIDFIDALVAAVAIAAGEWFFHMFIEKRVIGQGKQQ